MLLEFFGADEDAKFTLETSTVQIDQTSLHLPSSLEKLTKKDKHIYHGERDRVLFVKVYSCKSEGEKFKIYPDPAKGESGPRMSMSATQNDDTWLPKIGEENRVGFED